MKDMKLSKLVIVLLGIILLTGISATSFAAIPETMNYQGYLTDSGGVAVDVPVNITFRIYGDETGGTALWTETQSVSVNNGIYNVQLGSVSTLTSLTFDVPYWLGVEVETDGEMNPRLPFDSVPFAVISAVSEFATSVAVGSVNDSSIAGPISASKIEQGSGSTLNADFLDGQDSVDFANVSHIHGSADITQGSGSTLDADLLDGQDSAAFANTSHSHGSADITPPLSFLSDNGITIQTTSTHVNGTGIRGEGNYMGVAGHTQGVNGVGVYGLTGTTGANYGVFGYSRSPGGHGVHGMNDAGGYAGYFEGPVATTGNVTSGGTVTASSFSGSGANLMNLNATQITTGTVADSRLSVNVDLLDADKSVTGVKNFAPAVGTVPFTVDASKTGPVTNLNADLLDGQHSSDIIAAVADANQTVTGVKNFDPVSGTVPFTVDASKTGLVTNLNADLLDGQQASEIIAAAADEVRTPILACGTVSTPGSYYVTQNLSLTGTGICIDITASNVTIDLMGFELSGVGVGIGIATRSNSNVEIKNGTVRNFNDGIHASQASPGRSIRITNIRVLDNTSYGIMLHSRANLIKGCSALNNGEGGIWVSFGSSVIDSIGSYNVGGGIYAGPGSIIKNSTAYANQKYGIASTQEATVVNNTSYFNQLDGIYCILDCLVDGNTAILNNQSGGAYNNITACPTCTFGLNHAP